MRENKRKLGLVPKLIIAIVLGILIGQFLPEGFCRLVVTLSGLFSTFLKFVIPLMILAYVTTDHRSHCLWLHTDRRNCFLPGS